MSSLSQLIQKNLNDRRENLAPIDIPRESKTSIRSPGKPPRQPKVAAMESKESDSSITPATSATAAAMMRPCCHVTRRRSK